MGIDKFNHEGYSDPTTYEALTNIHREEVAADKKAAYLPLVYVCSSYAGDIENNVKNAKAYSRYAVKKNAIPVTPHLLYPQLVTIITNLIDGALTIIWLLNDKIMNPNFFEGIEQLFGENTEVISQVFIQFNKVFLAIIIFALGINCIETVIKALKYSRK